jgi:AcrR family transcriptional regulator
MNEKSRQPPRNAALTKARILAAAHDAFARSGYAQAGLRQIAAGAGVTSALLVRYFGTKAALFEAALVWTVERNSLFAPDKQGFGVAMAALVRARSSIDITAMLVLALADPAARPIATRVARERMIEPLAQWLGPPDALPRAMNMFGLLTGFAVQNHGIVEGEIPARSLAWLADTLQAIVDDR